MTQTFFIGVVVGFAIAGILTFVLPRHLTGVNNELISAGMAHHDPITGNVVWHTLELKD